jgi:hypothetical protein
MIVYAGASTVLGDGLREFEDPIPTRIGRYYDVPTKTIATRGASNSYLLRKINNFLENNTPTLLVVTWQTWEREEWLYNNEYYQVSATHAIDALPKELHTKYKTWAAEYTEEKRLELGSKWHKEIFELHQALKNKGIPHVFYHEMYPFTSETQLDWGNSFIDPYNFSFYWYLHNQGIQHDEWYHFGNNGHTLWTDFLIDYINKNEFIR